MEKLLEDAGVKLSVVATDIFGKSGRAMLDALIAGERDPKVLAELAWAGCEEDPGPAEALVGRFDDHHAFLARMICDHIDMISRMVAELTKRIDTEIEPYRSEVELLGSLPGVETRTAEVILAELGSRGALLRPAPSEPCVRLVDAHGSSKPRGRCGVLASCVCGLGARGGRRRVSSGFGHRPACRFRPGGRGSRRRSPCGPRSATTVPTPLRIGVLVGGEQWIAAERTAPGLPGEQAQVVAVERGLDPPPPGGPVVGQVGIVGRRRARDQLVPDDRSPGELDQVGTLPRSSRPARFPNTHLSFLNLLNLPK